MPAAVESLRRYVALARAVVRARQRAWRPFKLTWILTERCSLRCRTCQLWVAPQAGPSLATIREVLRCNSHLTWLNLSGGDLVERHDAPAILEAAVTSCRDLALLDFPTAGQDTAATLAALEPALDSAVPRIYVSVSLDGPDAVHDRVRGRRGAARRARQTLLRLQALRRPGFRAVAGMTLSRHNLPAVAPGDVHGLLPQGLPARDLHLNLAHHSTHYYRNRDDVRPPVATALAVLDAAQAGALRLLDPLSWVERRYWSLARRFLRDGSLAGLCGALRASVFLAPNLDVHPCSIFEQRLGNLADVGCSLDRLEELPAAHAALAAVDARACPGCWSPCEAFPTLLLGFGRTL